MTEVNLESRELKMMKRTATKKTVLSIFLSLLVLILIIFIRLISMDFEAIGTEFYVFLAKGSLITMGISNLAGIISSILDKDGLLQVIKKFFNSNDESTDVEIREQMIHLLFLIILFVGFIIVHTVLVLNDMNPVIMALSLIFYSMNIYLTYKHNYYLEQLNPDRYNEYNVDYVDNQMSVSERLNEFEFAEEERFDL